MSNISLPVSDLVNVQVNLSQTPAQAQNISTMLILGSSGIINSVERVRTYSSLSGVANDFGTANPEYYAAAEWFSQSPQPSQLLIGQWNNPTVYPSGTNALLIGSTIVSNIATWQAITAGSFEYNDAGPTHHSITGLNFSSVTNMNGVASIVQAALQSAGFSGASFVWNAGYSRFEYTNNLQVTIQFFTSAGTGVDISALLGMASTSSGAYEVPAITSPESAVNAIVLFDSSYGKKWYAAFIIGATDDDHLSVAQYIEGTNTKHAYAINSAEAGIITSTDTNNIAYSLKQLGYNKTFTQYSSSNQFAVISLAARIMTTNYTANKTVITLMYKQEPGVIPENLNESQMQALLANNANIFVEYDNSTAIIQPGVVASGQFIDTIFGADWLAITTQQALYNALYTTSTKIPQTDDGMNLLVASVTSVLDQGVDNGLLAPGLWTNSGFGTLKTGDYLPKGYYVYFTPIAKQNIADRAARKSTVIQIAAKLAGAIQSVEAVINFNA